MPRRLLGRCLEGGVGGVAGPQPLLPAPETSPWTKIFPDANRRRQQLKPYAWGGGGWSRKQVTRACILVFATQEGHALASRSPADSYLHVQVIDYLRFSRPEQAPGKTPYGSPNSRVLTGPKPESLPPEKTIGDTCRNFRPFRQPIATQRRLGDASGLSSTRCGLRAQVLFPGCSSPTVPVCALLLILPRGR